MNEDLKKLEERLTLATTADGLPGDELDPETASLQAGWLALGELLDKAQPEMEMPVRSVRFRPARSNRRRLATMLAGLAASALVAFVGVKYWATSNEVAVSDGPAQVAPRQVVQAMPEPQPSETADTTANAVALAADDAAMAWNDSFDRDIEQTQFAIQMASRDPLAWSASPSQIDYQIESMRLEMEKNSL